MSKKIICILLALSLLGVFGFGFTGCDLISRAQSTETAIPASVKAVREAKIGQTLMMKQMEIDLENEVSIIVTLSQGNTVDGYFYLLKGSDISFNISGITSMYTSPPTDPKTGEITSDRFSFQATATQGTHYTLKFTPPTDKNGKTPVTAVFMELILPVTGSISVPLGTK